MEELNLEDVATKTEPVIFKDLPASYSYCQKCESIQETMTLKSADLGYNETMDYDFITALLLLGIFILFLFDFLRHKAIFK